MITKEVTYENFEGETVKETLHFHLNKQELTELSVTNPEYLSNMLNAVKNKDVSEIYKIFKGIVLKAYGVKIDNNTFVKGEKTKNFEYTLAFDALMEDIVMNENSMFSFFKDILPKEVASEFPDTPAVYTEEKSKELIEELEQKINA